MMAIFYLLALCTAAKATPQAAAMRPGPVLCGNDVAGVVWGRHPDDQSKPLEKRWNYFHHGGRHFGKSIAGGARLNIAFYNLIESHGRTFQFAEAWNVSCPRSYLANHSEASSTGTEEGLWFTCAFRPLEIYCTPAILYTHSEQRLLGELPKLEKILLQPRELLQLQPWARMLVDEIKEKFKSSEALTSNYASFQIRRGDKCMWGPLNRTVCPGCEASCVHASEFLKHVPGNLTNIFVMTDDFAVLQEVQGLTRARVVSMATIDYTGRSSGGRKLSAYGHFAQFWAEAEIALEGGIVVAGMHSNVGSLLKEMRSKSMSAVINVETPL